MSVLWVAESGKERTQKHISLLSRNFGCGTFIPNHSLRESAPCLRSSVELEWTAQSCGRWAFFGKIQGEEPINEETAKSVNSEEVNSLFDSSRSWYVSGNRTQGVLHDIRLIETPIFGLWGFLKLQHSGFLLRKTYVTEHIQTWMMKELRLLAGNIQDFGKKKDQQWSVLFQKELWSIHSNNSLLWKSWEPAELELKFLR